MQLQQCRPMSLISSGLEGLAPPLSRGQLTRCFSAVADLLVGLVIIADTVGLGLYSKCFRFQWSKDLQNVGYRPYR